MTYPMTLDEAQALAASFIENRRALHGDLRMEDAPDAAAQAAAAQAAADKAEIGRAHV